MPVTQSKLAVDTNGRGLIEISDQVNQIIQNLGVETGIAQVFLQHTSASLILNENADPTVQTDLETVIQRLAPDGDPEYIHNYEGDDDMAGHVRAMLTTNEVSIPVSNGRLALGAWQGLFLWEHRYRPHRRSLVVTVLY